LLPGACPWFKPLLARAPTAFIDAAAKNNGPEYTTKLSSPRFGIYVDKQSPADGNTANPESSLSNAPEAKEKPQHDINILVADQQLLY
jgi:hypothetical protein